MTQSKHELRWQLMISDEYYYYTDLDIDECTLGVDQCHSVATCTNTRGSYFCTCPPGSSGDGFNCIGELL